MTDHEPEPAAPTHEPHAGRAALATVAVTAGRPPAEPDGPLSTPVVLASTFVSSPGGPQAGDRGYGRWGNPTWEALEEAVAALEGGRRALSFASGLAAVSAVLELVPVGGTVVIPAGAYNGTNQVVDRLVTMGALNVRTVPIGDTAAVAAALPGADLLMVESPTNPLLEVADLAGLAAAARAEGVLMAVDSTFATPLLQRPLATGATIVLHSASKYLSGHSDLLMGVVVTDDEAVARRLHEYRTLRGAVPGPMEAWLALRGLRTLALRVERAGSNAAELARRLVGHPAVERVRHPSLPTDPGHERARAQMDGFGAIVGLEVRGGAEAAERVCAAVRLWVHTTSLGGVESTLERRRRYPSESVAVPPSLLRLSVGIEAVDDLWRDLDAALRETL
jgi:cystathionine gamma-synthase